MSSHSGIEWTEATWNPVTGCSKVSPGCRNCYAERLSKRLQAMGQRNYRNGFELTLQRHMLELPLKWKKPRIIFVNSMSDLFHEGIPVDYVQEVFSIMRKANQHIFQVLTKRSNRLHELSERLEWAENIWMGVSVENSDYTYRIDHLRGTDASVKFLSFEPLIGPVNNINLEDIDWVIVGGESGPSARTMKKEWVTDIRDNCVRNGIPFFFKQWGGFNKKKTGRELDGRTWDGMPSYAY